MKSKFIVALLLISTFGIPTHIFGYQYVGNDPINKVDPLGLWGVGVQGSETTDIGIGPISAGQTGAVGGGFFMDGWKPSLGGFGSWGGFARFLKHEATYPNRNTLKIPCNEHKPWAAGAFAGAGGSAFITNAESVKDLSGPFRQYNLTAGWFFKGLGLSLAIGKGGTWVFSYGGPFPVPTGVGFGAAASSYPTKTKTTSD